MHSVSDLTTSSRRTSGDVPPRLVGASTTVVDDKMYLFGGRLVTERRMVSDLYVIDLETLVWQKIVPHANDDVPGARYFHSTDAWNNCLVVFGGMGHKPDAASTDDLCVLSDVRYFNLTSRRWLPADSLRVRTTADPVAVGSTDADVDAANDSDHFTPRARYAHLSSVTTGRLFVIGGQDLNNVWLDDVCVFDLAARAWVHRREYPRHSGTYRSVAVAADLRVRFPREEAKTDTVEPSPLGPPGGRYKIDKRPPSAGGAFTSPGDLEHLPYSTDPTDEFPNDIFLYSNYNFTDVKRELEVFSPLPGGREFQMADRSSAMSGTVLPPGLRFPTGAICGTHLIFAGTYLAHSYQSYSIWALDLTTMTWMRLDPGSALSSGSWFRACLWSSPGKSKFLIFGNKQGNLVEDYNRRLLSWDDVAVIDLEAFGVYQPPRPVLDHRGQELGLAALEEGLLADFEVVCDDGRKIGCSRQLLENRWPWFRDQRRHFVDVAMRALEGIQGGVDPLPPDPTIMQRPAGEEAQPDPRLTPRSLLLSEPYPVTLALLQYFYSLSLLTKLQHAPAVLSQLMLLSATYNLPHLQALVKHAMHRALTPTTSVGVYEVATLCSCQSLQIRALKAVMASSRRTAPGRNRGNSAGGNGNDGGGGGGGGHHAAARPRGMSDLRGFPRPDGMGGGQSSTGAADGGYINGTRHALGAVADLATIPSAGASSRVKHSVNLSLNSIYVALKTADENYGDDHDAEGHSADSAAGDSGTDSDTPMLPVRRKVKRVESNPALAIRLNAASHESSSVGQLHPWSSFEQLSAQSHPPSRFASNNTLSSLSTSHYPTHLEVPRLHNEGELPSLSSSNTSTVSSVNSLRGRPSPLTPDSPLPTPVEGFGHVSMAGSVTTPLSAIDERHSYEETLNGDRVPTPDSRVRAVNIVDPEAGGQSGWNDLKDPSVYGSSLHSPASSGFPEPLSPAKSSFLSESMYSGSTSDAQHSGGSVFHRTFFSSKTLKTEKEAAKARAKAERLQAKVAAHARAEEERQRIALASSIRNDSHDVKKATKAEEKRRRKEEEKRRIERLAEELKARALRGADGLSMASSGSSERKIAHEWVEGSSGGMYGDVGGWGSL